jgi:hypothetical protein
LNEALIQEALAISEQENLETVVETALREYIQRRKIVELFGMIDYDETYDYKAQRQI